MYLSNCKRRHLLVILAGLTAVIVSGCGGTNSRSQEDATEAASSRPGKPFTGPAEITKFGGPGSPSERQAASIVLNENLEARESGDFARQCASLDAEAQTEITGAKTPGERVAECPTQLEAMAKPLKETAAVRQNTLDGPIDELRVKGPKAFALYHGSDGTNYSIPLRREGGRWKVGSIVTTEIG